MSTRHNLVPVLLLATSACAAPADEAESNAYNSGGAEARIAPSSLELPGEERQSRLEALTRDLGIGDQGDDVEAVHAFLATYGYFPNARLAHDYPNWRPIVETAPAAARAYDEHTADAVRAFQYNMGLEETGAVDAPTRAMLTTPRCGYPDGVQALDPSDKFDYNGSAWPKSALKWKLTTTDSEDGLKPSTIIARSFGVWANRTKLTFSSTTSTPDITIKFQAASGFLGSTSPAPPNAPVTTMNSNFNWSDTIPVPAGKFDMETTLIHELGHALGFGHSSNPLTNCYTQDVSGMESTCAVMFPAIAGGVYRRLLKNDDLVVAGTLYDKWTTLPGSSALDVAANVYNQVWVIGTVQAPAGGYRVYKWDGSTGFIADSALGGAERGITVEDGAIGRPWVVNHDGEIYRRTSSDPTTGSWQRIQGPCAMDIAAGGGMVWITSCDQKPAGFTIYKWNGSTWDLDTAGGIGWHIAVKSFGAPWVVRTSGRIYFRTGTNPNSGSWTEIPGDSGAGRGFDIAFGRDVPYVIGSIAAGNGNQVYVLDQQGPTTMGSPPARPITDWFPVAGAAGNRIAATAAASLWLARGNVTTPVTVLRNTN